MRRTVCQLELSNMYSHLGYFGRLCLHSQTRTGTMLLQAKIFKFQSQSAIKTMTCLIWKEGSSFSSSCKNIAPMRKTLQLMAVRTKSGVPPSKAESNRNKTVTLYVLSIGIFMVGMSYAGVPLYKLFCQVII